MTAADKTILERIRRYHADRAGALAVKVRYADRDARLRVESWKAEITTHNQHASNLERIIAR